MKQTAVEWLVEQIKEDSNLRLRGFDIDGIGKQAKEMEKQQIINSRITAPSEVVSYSEIISIKEAKEYYNETFKNK
jgi:hypothetical protein